METRKRVKFITSAASSNETYVSGKEYDLLDVLADDLIKAGHVIEVIEVKKDDIKDIKKVEKKEPKAK